MKTLMIAAGVLAISAPALAQTTGSQTAVPPTTDSMSTPSASAPAPVAQEAPAAAATPTDPKAIISTEFPTYDKDSNGALSRAEFDAWMVALKEKSGDTAMKPADQTAWLKSAFTTADKDKNKGVSLAELTNYLTAAG